MILARVSAETEPLVLSSCERLVRNLGKLWREPVAKPEVRVDEPPVGQRLLELHAEPSDVDVDRPIARSHLSSPGQAEQFLALDDPISAARELDEDAQLLDRERQSPTSCARDVVRGQDLERSDLERLEG